MFIREEERNSELKCTSKPGDLTTNVREAMSGEETSGKEKSVKFKESKPSISLTNDEGEQLNGLDRSK